MATAPSDCIATDRRPTAPSDCVRVVSGSWCLGRGRGRRGRRRRDRPGRRGRGGRPGRPGRVFQVLSHLGVALGMHYLSFLDLLLMPRSHKPAGKPTENPELLNPKLSLVIHGAFSFFRPSGKAESSMNYKG